MSSTDQALPHSLFPYRNALLYGTNHNLTSPFGCSNDLIEFVCHHLRLHGFGFLVDAELDTYQLDLPMVVSWGILQSKKKTLNQHPSKATVECLSSQVELNDLGLLLKTRRSSQMMLLPLKKCVRV
jgi:hypothetical protein